MNPAGIDPSVIEIEQGANCDGEVNGFVVPSGFIQGRHVFRRDSVGVMVYLVDKAKQPLVFLVKGGRFGVVQHFLHQVLAPQQFRRNCGVRLQSKRTAIAIRGVGCD